MNNTEFPNIKLISFDLWRTIINVNPEFDRHRHSLFLNILASHQSITEGHFAEMFELAKKHAENLSEKQERHISWSARIKILCDYIGIDNPSKSKLHDLKLKHDALALKYPPLLVSAHVLTFFKTIVENNKDIGIISNTGLLDSVIAKKVLTMYGLSRYITYYVFSDETKLAKPNTLMYLNLADQAGYSSFEILHVGDSLTADYNGALKAGLNSIHSPLHDACIEKLGKLLQT